MRRSPWIPLFVLLAIGLYFAPREGERAPTLNFDLLNFGPLPSAAPEEALRLPSDVEALFKKSRPATVRVEQVGLDGSTAVGTGFFIDDAGTLLTAHHVVEDGGRLRVTTLSGMRFNARLVGFDAAHDLAVLKANVRGKVPFLTVADAEPALRSRVLAIGNSREQFLQPRFGRVLEYDARAYRADFPQDTLKIDAPIAPGDSGGPIINTAGEAVGVVSYIQLADGGLAPSSTDVRTIAAYAVPVTRGDEVLRAVVAGEERDVPVMGVAQSRHEELLGVEGAVIGSVVPGSPAERAGLRSENFSTRRDASGRQVRRFSADVIVAVNGERVRDFNEMVFRVRGNAIGDTITLTVRRGGEELQVPVTLTGEQDLER